MSLINRQPRPLKRDFDTFRDDRLFIVACDDTYAPKQYFNFFRISRIQVHVVVSEDGKSAAPYVLERLLLIDHYDDDELWILLDTDHYIKGEHLRRFTETLLQAKNHGVAVALSRPCFEIWLLLHHCDHSTVVGLNNATLVEKQLRSILGEYNKTNLKKAHFPIEKVVNAIKEAKSLDQEVGGGEIPESTTTRVYLLWESIISKALPSQLPKLLAEIRPYV
jgi:hypothetical protein